MATGLRCPRGHLWEPRDAATVIAPADVLTCPVCGVTWSPVTTLIQTPEEVHAATDNLDGPSETMVQPADDVRGTRSDPLLPPIGSAHHIPGFEILGVLGRGGMGSVYRARHIKTDRVVALKVPHADRMDSEIRERLQTEAKAAARLQHSGIVQMFEVGEEEGQPYLVLEYCPGGSLARKLAGTPMAPRLAAEVVTQVAVAVGFAHRAGVIHRDLKPDNILIGAEPAGYKVADFGLARRTDIEQGQTVTGAIMGTPSYMAPEQARGDTHHVGPAADVYALGAVLYECLTGRPPLKGATPLDTLEQVCTRDPVPPSRLQPTVPRDLETIALACLRKEPDRRYASADHLADDLKRFLTGRPILARPVGWPERLVKRARRNPLLSALAVMLAAAVVAGVGFGVWKQVRLTAERDRARAHFQMSLRAIDELFTAVAEQDLAAEPRAERTRRALLEKAMHFYQELLAVEAGDPTVAWEAARAARRMGDIERLLNRYPAALANYEQAAERLSRLQSTRRDDAELWREVALTHTGRGEVYRLTERLDAADAEYAAATEILTRLRREFPDDPVHALDLAQSLYNRGIVAGTTGRGADAEVLFRQAADALGPTTGRPPEHRQHAARIALNLADVLRKARRPADSATAANDAVRLLDALIVEYPARPDYQHERAAAGNNLAIARAATNDIPSAVTAASDARRRLEGLVRDYPSTPLYRVDLARTCTTMAGLENARKDKPAAEAHTRAAVGHWEVLLAVRSDVPSDHGDLGIALGNLGRLTKTRPAEARPHLTRGLAELLVALRANPAEADFRDSLRGTARDLADLLVTAGDDAAVVEWADRIRDGLPGNPLGTRQAVGFLGRAATAASKKPDDAVRRADAFARKAVALLQAVDAKASPGLLDDPDSEPFRRRPEFREWLGPAHR